MIVLIIVGIGQKLYGFQKFRALNQPFNKLYLKKPTGMHWLGYNDAVSSLNEAKTRIFQPTANFENFEIHLYFVSQPAVRPGCTRCRAPEISHDL